jgi:serine/threonine protein kinase
MDRQQQFVGMYDFKDTLGKGHFSVVKLAEHVISKQKVAIKIIEKAKLKPLDLEHIHHEVRVMKMLQHPNVVRLYEVYDTAARLFLILELGSGGDLFEYITRSGRLPEETAKEYFSQIVSAVDYCHKHRVAHRDLKPENVVFCSGKGGRTFIKVQKKMPLVFDLEVFIRPYFSFSIESSQGFSCLGHRLWSQQQFPAWRNDEDYVWISVLLSARSSSPRAIRWPCC